MKNCILFASGGGSNVRAILNFFKNDSRISFPLIVTNKSTAGVIDIAHEFEIELILINKLIFEDEKFIKALNFYQPDLIVLAGFLWKVPSYLIKSFPSKIINIHPALLPKYGGKGMYGHYVHEAVVANAETESGITIHYVNENYDEGNIILQQKISINPIDDAFKVAQKVLKLEHEHLPKVIEQLLKK